MKMAGIKKTGMLLLWSVFFLAPLAAGNGEPYPPEGWMTDVKQAFAESEKTGKDILINFTGSDWCGWCKKLWSDVFGTREFRKYADKNLILLFLDSPRGMKQSEETKKQNQVMSRLFGVQGYPTIWVLDSELTPVMKTGYQVGGAKKYIEHLKKDRPPMEEKTKKEYREMVRNTVKKEIGNWQPPAP